MIELYNTCACFMFEAFSEKGSLIPNVSSIFMCYGDRKRKQVTSLGHVLGSP